MDFSPVLALNRTERSALSFALELTADFLGVDVADVLAKSFARQIESFPGGTNYPATVEIDSTAPQDAAPAPTDSPQTLRVDLSGKSAQKLRANFARALYDDDLKKDVVDRATAAVVAKLASKNEINRAIAGAVRSAKDNARRGLEPTRAWLLFYPYLKGIYERNGVAFPKLSPVLEKEPPEIASKRETEEKERAALQAALVDLDRRDAEN
ncbi:hypothetical protein IJ103_00030 [Candidatus Saccharibacteria bacterium]|nr:hypothetical protein [Candidatus Saccharibacteria bacterium]